MKNFIYILLGITISSCHFPVQKSTESMGNTHDINTIASGENMCCSYMTHDNLNNVVLSWVDGKDENAVLFYSVYKNEKFQDPVAVAPSRGLTPHHESMPKVAFKADGTVIAVYGHRRRVNRPDAMFEGEIYYTQSFDNGKTWTMPQFLHSDTTIGYSRGFFDLTALPDGEVAAVWLDARKKLKNGSTLYFSKTDSKQGFVNDIDIAQKVCECCRTDIYVDSNNNINIAFRDIWNDSIRDVSLVVSADMGSTFGNPVRISEDNWILDGCPHSGPTITSNKDGTHFFWFTNGGHEGVYTTGTKDSGKTFTERKLINHHARHPQSTSLKDGTLVMVWDEVFKTKTNFITKAGIEFFYSDGTTYKYYLTNDDEECFYPVVMSSVENKTIVAWTSKKSTSTSINYTIIKHQNYSMQTISHSIIM